MEFSEASFFDRNARRRRDNPRSFIKEGKKHERRHSRGAGVQKTLETLDSRLRGNDEKAAVRRPVIPLPLPFVPSRKGRGDELWESLKRAFSDFLGGPQRWGGVRRFRDE